MFSGIRYVLRHLGQEVRGIEHLEVAGGPGQQFLVPRFGESAHRIMLRFVDHLPGLGHLDHPGLAEGAAQEVLDQALQRAARRPVGNGNGG